VLPSGLALDAADPATKNFEKSFEIGVDKDRIESRIKNCPLTDNQQKFEVTTSTRHRAFFAMSAFFPSKERVESGKKTDLPVKRFGASEQKIKRRA
jgi:hypothetical protein